jgi:hypothetical protein
VIALALAIVSTLPAGEDALRQAEMQAAAVRALVEVRRCEQIVPCPACPRPRPCPLCVCPESELVLFPDSNATPLVPVPSGPARLPEPDEVPRMEWIPWAFGAAGGAILGVITTIVILEVRNGRR